MKRHHIAFLLIVSVIVCACMSNEDHPVGPMKPSNDFNFSTVNDGVSVNVEYANTGVNASVYFEIYDTCPVDLKDTLSNYVKLDNILPIFSGYTDVNGRFSGTVSLPAYAEKLYFYAPAFYARTLIEAQVRNNAVYVTDAPEDGTKAGVVPFATTTSAHYSYMAEDCKKHIPDQYKRFMRPWKCWLGEYDKYANGSVKSYECTREDLLPKNASELFLTFHDVLKTAKDYRYPEEFFCREDLYMAVDGPVSVTFLGQNTCFNNSVGYYFYQEGNRPSRIEDIDAILIFPNTQDGLWEKSNDTNQDARPSAGLERLTTVQLKYYPNIAEGSMDGETEIFPAGTRIGFVLATNAFSNRISFVWTRNNHNLSATTPGISISNDGKLYDKSVSRTVLFRVDGNVFLGFEDYKDDTNMSDCVLSINSISSDAIQVATRISRNDVEIETEEVGGVYAFEDIWPYEGDYDLNDVIVSYNHESIYSDGLIVGESFIIKTFQNGASNKNGLGFSLSRSGTGFNGNFQSLGTFTTFIKLRGSEEFVPFDMVFEPKDVDGNNLLPVYLITDDVKENMGAEYKFMFTYNQAVAPSDNALKMQILLKQRLPIL
ncbi:MAG: LruC domain-containing protein, partial [Candidatus Cryptobacteroides sp.]